MVANDDPSAYGLPFFKRLGMAMENGWRIFVDLIIGIANIWVFVLAGIGIWLVVKHFKKKKILV